MENTNHKYLVTSTPHIRSKANISEIMLDVIIALAPAAVMGAFYFGPKAITIMVLSVASCVLFELLYQMYTKKEVTISDFSAVVTGLLLAFNLPASAPFWLPIVGGFFAIVLVKQLFGGLGQNFMNPALCARAFLLAAYPTQMTDWSVQPNSALVDGIASATPLDLVKHGFINPYNVLERFNPRTIDILKAIIGKIGGSIGETCALALIAGGLYLIARKVISWRIPVIYIGTSFFLFWVFGRHGFFTGNPQYEIFIGGLMLGAFFMATDYSSSPIAPKGQVIFALGCAILTVLIRVYGSYPEGVSFAILLMNVATPLIDKLTEPKIYGLARRSTKKEVRRNV